MHVINPISKDDKRLIRTEDRLTKVKKLKTLPIYLIARNLSEKIFL